MTVNDGSYLQNNNIEGHSLEGDVNTVTDTPTLQQSNQDTKLRSTN